MRQPGRIPSIVPVHTPRHTMFLELDSRLTVGLSMRITCSSNVRICWNSWRVLDAEKKVPGEYFERGDSGDMKEAAWVKEFPAAITVCDTSGLILEMNDRSSSAFAEEGGAALIGKNLLDCHPGPAAEKVAALLRSGSVNCYTIEKGGIRKLIYQSPWFENGTYRGFVEISFPVPEQMPHFVRE